MYNNPDIIKAQKLLGKINRENSQMGATAKYWKSPEGRKAHREAAILRSAERILLAMIAQYR